MKFAARMLIAITKENLHPNTNAKRRTFCSNSRPNYFISPDCDQAAHASGKCSNTGHDEPSCVKRDIAVGCNYNFRSTAFEGALRRT
jgi:hypothetical protein